MVNERITEDIVRSHFKNDAIFDKVIFEEQISHNERIKNLLKTASKRGTGKPGYPEFIMTFPTIMDLVLIIECKAESKHHESKNKSEPEKYAVDGVLHYAKFLQSDFNIMAIAVSGQSEHNISISNFLIKKNEHPKKIDQKLLSIYDYLNLIENEDNAEAFKNENISLTASALNDKLYEFSVPENERATIVSGILIALQHDVFRKSFQTYADPPQLVEDLLKSVERVLKKNVAGSKIPILMEEYNTIKKSSKLAKLKKIRNPITEKEEDNRLLKELISEINSKVFPFTTSNNVGYDILGEFYSEFIRYTNGDRKLGLVLTPQHIAELFVDLASLQKDDVLYDSCCGTGGFLIKGMKKLIQLSGNDSEKIQHIKQNQILGIEERSDMFTYACSNMMMRGDGKSKILLGDSLSEEKKSFIKKNKPTVGMLNPPYATSISELEFVYNNLECLEKNGICIAIIPINTILADSGNNYERKKQLLSKHTLEAVFSMNAESFYPIGVVTAIVVLKAHNPHPDDYETYFGYWINDNFVKQKPLGRIDKNNTWEEIKKNWLYNFKNRKVVQNQSITKHITPKDEWCAEAYMPLNYKSKINEQSFEKILKDYVIINILHQRC